MNIYEIIIDYTKPCRLGGIQSATQRFSLEAHNEDEAERLAKIQGVEYPFYLNTICLEVRRFFS